jgi:hypothetical protein
MKTIAVTIAFLFFACDVFAQQKEDPLFDVQTPLHMAFGMSFKQIRNSKEDTEYIAHVLYYYDAAGSKDSINVGLKARGNYRLSQCVFPPLWISIKKKASKNTVFEGNKKIKLVLPCYNQDYNNEFILKEYVCYKLYEVITPYHFKTRLANVDLTELRKKNRQHELKGIMIEDVDKTAKRFNAQSVKSNVHSISLSDTNTLRFTIFQFMIGNTDWSASFQHNCKLIFQKPNIIPIPYDFDMSGLVNAPYAVVSEVNGKQIPIQSVTERYYMGACRSPGATEFVRQEYLSKEQQILAVPDILKGQLPDKEIEDIKDYLKEFFTILKDDRSFHDDIVNGCKEISTPQ